MLNTLPPTCCIYYRAGCCPLMASHVLIGISVKEIKPSFWHRPDTAWDCWSRLSGSTYAFIIRSFYSHLQVEVARRFLSSLSFRPQNLARQSMCTAVVMRKKWNCRFGSKVSIWRCFYRCSALLRNILDLECALHWNKCVETVKENRCWVFDSSALVQLSLSPPPEFRPQRGTFAFDNAWDFNPQQSHFLDSCVSSRMCSFTHLLFSCPFICNKLHANSRRRTVSRSIWALLCTSTGENITHMHKLPPLPPTQRQHTEDPAH